MVAKVLMSMGEMVQAQAMLYKDLFQTLLLYGRESLVVTGEMLKNLERFHHRLAKRNSGKMARRTVNG